VTEPIFDLTVSRHGSSVVIAASGEIDLESAPALAASLAQVTDAGAGGVVVDLTDVEFLDSSGLTALVTGARNLKAKGIPFHVVVPDANTIRKVIEITRLTEPLHVVSTLEDALG
jgi:anti-sigma B factor antagonist